MGSTMARRVTLILFALMVVLRAGPAAHAQTAAPSGGPDIVGIRVGIQPQEAYALLQKLDPAHRVTVAQIGIPVLLGDKEAVYAMAPENLNAGLAETINLSITLPPNPQQVFQVHRVLNQTIHTTIDQILASLRQKYGTESYSSPTGSVNALNLVWLYDRKGQLASPAVGATTMRICSNYFQFAGPGNYPLAAQTLSPGVLNLPNGITAPYPITQIQDPAKNPQCVGWVRVNGNVIGGLVNGAYTYSLDVTISDFDLQKTSAIALSVVLNNAQNQRQQQDLNKAKQQSVPNL